MERQRSVEEWTVEEVVLFFVQHRLQDHLSVVRTHAIDGAKLASLDEGHLAELGISKRNDRRRLLDQVAKLRADPPQTSFTYSEVKARQAAQQSLESEVEELVARLKEMFTGIAEPTIRYIVSSNDNDEGAATDTLLAMQAVDRGKATSPVTQQSRARPATFELQGASLGESSSDSPTRHATMRRPISTSSTSSSSASDADAVVLEHLCGLFPDLEPELVVHALDLNDGDADAAIDQLLSLNTSFSDVDDSPGPADGSSGDAAKQTETSPDRRATIRRPRRPTQQLPQSYKRQTIINLAGVSDPVYMSRTKAEYSDDDLYDSLARAAPSPSLSESTTDSDLEEDEDEWCLVRAGLECLDSVAANEQEAPISVITVREGAMSPRLMEERHAQRLTRLFPDLPLEKMVHSLREHSHDVDTTVRALSKQDAQTPVRPLPQRASSVAEELARSAPEVSADKKRPQSEYGLRRKSLRRASLMLKQTEKQILQHNRWQDRPDVRSCGLFDSLPQEEVKRQEAIWEVAVSEEAYLKDVKTLQELVLKPMQELFRKSRKSSRETTLDFSFRSTSAMLRTVEKLYNQGVEFLKRLRFKQANMLQVDTVSDILLENVPEFTRVFAGYCSVCFQLQRVDETNHKELKALFKQAAAQPMARSLPIDAFILAPIQRLARYPLLVQAIIARTPEDHADHAELQRAHAELTECVQACNARLRSLEDFALLEKLDQQMDYSRLQNHAPLTQRNRSLLRRGVVKFVRPHRGKISKSKAVELFLFTDMLMYAKPVRTKKKTTYTVYKQIHRSLVEARDANDSSDLFPALASMSSAETECMFSLVLYGQQPLTLLAKAPTATDKQRWLDVLNPPKQPQEYAEWDCPRVRVVKDYDATQRDELTLRVGDVLNIIVRNQDGFSKGAIVSTVAQTNRQTRGWFPVTHVKEIVSKHSEAKVFKANFQAKAAKPDIPK